MPSNIISTKCVINICACTSNCTNNHLLKLAVNQLSVDLLLVSLFNSVG